MSSLLQYDPIIDGAIECPRCEGNNLHHTRIAVFQRPEDGPQALTLIGEGKLPEWQGYNPSRRRDGLQILFWCEGCPAQPVLNIFQHKGSTYIEWDTSVRGDTP